MLPVYTINKSFQKKVDRVIFTCLFFIFLSIAFNRVPGPTGVIWSDTEGYYMYLPAAFIYKDVHHIPQRSMNYRLNEKDEVVDKYTCGVAFFYLPFFIGAHIYAHAFHYDTSGFSAPYHQAIILCGVFWGCIGLFLLKKLLSRYFSTAITWLTLTCIALGTNFFHYVTQYMGMSHVYSFTLVAAILLLTDDYYKKPSVGKSILLSLFLGLLVLIRPTNCVLLLFLLLYQVTSVSTFKQRMIFLKSHIKDICIGLPFFFVVFIPQLLYWKEMLGKWVTYSYDGERFIYWKHPKIAAVLFDTQNGLFLYSPILLFMFWGLLSGRKDPRTNFWGTSVVFTVITYLFASWWAWWFGAAFGHRCYIEYFPVFAFPMAFSIEKVFTLKRYLKIAFLCVIALLIYYSIAMSYLFDKTGIWDGPSWRWNWDKWIDLVKSIF